MIKKTFHSIRTKKTKSPSVEDRGGKKSIEEAAKYAGERFGRALIKLSER